MRQTATQLIEKLQKLVAEHGDLPVEMAGHPGELGSDFEEPYVGIQEKKRVAYSETEIREACTYKCVFLFC